MILMLETGLSQWSFSLSIMHWKRRRSISRIMKLMMHIIIQHLALLSHTMSKLHSRLPLTWYQILLVQHLMVTTGTRFSIQTTQYSLNIIPTITLFPQPKRYGSNVVNNRSMEISTYVGLFMEWKQTLWFMFIPITALINMHMGGTLLMGLNLRQPLTSFISCTKHSWNLFTIRTRRRGIPSPRSTWTPAQTP